MRFLAWAAAGISPVVLIVAALLYRSVPDFSAEPHLPDEELIDNFQSHRADFDKLVEMVLQDNKLTRVDVDWTEPRDPETVGISAERLAEYRKLFGKLGIKSGFSAPQTRDQIEFLASTQGWVAHGSEKGYLYATSLPARFGPVVDSLDQYSSSKRPVGGGCRHIQGNWYLYFYGD